MCAYGCYNTGNNLTGYIEIKKEVRDVQKTSGKNKHGMGTVEIVIIIAVLVALALVFRAGLMRYADNVMNFVFDEGRITGAFG